MQLGSSSQINVHNVSSEQRGETTHAYTYIYFLLVSAFPDDHPDSFSFLERLAPKCGWLCRGCGKQGLKGDIVRHIEYMHLPSKELPCPLCSMRLKTAHSRQVHYKRVHGLQATLQEIEAMLH